MAVRWHVLGPSAAESAVLNASRGRDILRTGRRARQAATTLPQPSSRRIGYDRASWPSLRTVKIGSLIDAGVLRTRRYLPGGRDRLSHRSAHPEQLHPSQESEPRQAPAV